MSAEKTVLIVTDGHESIDFIATSIKNALTHYNVKHCKAEDYAGTDLLPAGTFFIGCDKSNPSSFSYLEEMLAHINLASRKCGIFSTNNDAINYLSGILKDCDAAVGKPLVTDASSCCCDAVKSWLNEIL